MKPYYKTSKGKVVELEQQNKLYLWTMNIIELILPDGCKEVYCFNNQLKELIIPKWCECVLADMKSINELNKVDRLNLWI